MGKMNSSGIGIDGMGTVKIITVIGHNMIIKGPTPSQINGSFTSPKTPIIKRVMASKR